VRRPYVFEQAQILPVPPFQYRSTLWLVALGWRNRFVGEGVRLSDYGLVERCFKDSILRPAWGLGDCIVECIPKMICGNKNRLLSCPVERLAAARP